VIRPIEPTPCAAATALSTYRVISCDAGRDTRIPVSMPNRGSPVNSPQQYKGSGYFRQGGRDESVVAGGGFFCGGRAG
jgi:hypothetical protein